MLTASNAPEPAEALKDKSVAVVDMVGYSTVARVLEENCGPQSVADLNEQIRRLIQRTIQALGEAHACTVIARTGDGVIAMFDSPVGAHLFAVTLLAIADNYNRTRTEASAKRRFRIGVASGDIIRRGDGGDESYAGITIANAVRLESAARACEIVVAAATYAALPPELRSDYGPEEVIAGKRDEQFRVRRLAAAGCETCEATPAALKLTRRKVLALTGAASAAVIAGVAVTHLPLNRPPVLPARRFVALMAWPRSTELSGSAARDTILQAIEADLARAEAADRNLLVIGQSMTSRIASASDFHSLVEQLGTNLILAVGVKAQQAITALTMRVLDPVSAQVIRGVAFEVPTDERDQLVAKSISAARDLLEVKAPISTPQLARPGTMSDDAHQSFQAAQAIMDDANEARLSEAIKKYKLATEQDPNYAAAYAGLARAYFRSYMLHGDAGALALARSNCARALTIDPSSISGRLALSLVLEFTGDADGAYRTLTEALTQDPADARVLTYIGRLEARLNRWQDAETSLQRSLQLRPNYWLNHIELGVLYFLQAKYRAALAEFQASSLAAPQNALALNNMGAILSRQGNIDKAIPFIRKSLALNPDDIPYTTLATALRLGGDARQAVACARKAVEINPTDCSNWVELGDSLSADRATLPDVRRAFTRAVQAQEEALRTNPTDGPGWMLLALSKAKVGDAAAVDDLLEKARTNFSDDIDSQLYKVRVLALLKRNAAALNLAAVCSRRGATKFELDRLPDCDSVRALSGYAAAVV